MVDKTVPDIVVGRLPRYLQALQRMQQEDILTTSSQDLGERLGISAAQIRKDLSQFGEFGKQGTGYSVSFLVNQVQEILNVNKVWDIVLVGAGDLGHAIARYQGFSNRGFRIVMIFDADEHKVGKQIGKLEIHHVSNLKEKVRAAGVKIGMLTVPASVAQKVAEELTEAGVQAILNYAPVPLSVPKHVRVQHIDPIIQLQHMTFYLE